MENEREIRIFDFGCEESETGLGFEVEVTEEEEESGFAEIEITPVLLRKLLRKLVARVGVEEAKDKLGVEMVTKTTGAEFIDKDLTEQEEELGIVY